MPIQFKLDMSSSANYSPTYGKGDVWTVSGNTMALTNIYTITSAVSPSGAGSVSGTGKFQSGKSCTLKATPGTNYSFVNWTKGGSQVSTSASYTFTVNASASYVANFKLKQATLTSAPNFTDDDNPRITYTNPGSGATIYAYIEVREPLSRPIAERQISGTSYTFNFTEEERTTLRRINTKSNTQTVRFVIRTRIGSQDYYSYLDKTLTINNPNPIFNPSPVVEDINPITLALTGSKDKLVKYYSNAQITFNDQAVKGASITSKSVKCGGKSLTANGTINEIESGVFDFVITDSRGNTTTKQITKTMVDYIKLTCNLGNAIPDASGNYDLEVAGNCFTGNFGATANTLTLQYRYKQHDQPEDKWIEWQNVEVSANDNTYNAYATITISEFDYRKTYDIQARAIDKLTTIESGIKSVKSTPVFDWSGKDFNFNVPIIAQDTLDVKKGIFVDGINLIDILYPVGSIYTSVNSTNPANIFGGEWTQITGRFLYCSTTSKQTGGSNTINLAHTHTTSGHRLTVNEMPAHNHTRFTTAIIPKGNGGSEYGMSNWRTWNGLKSIIYQDGQTNPEVIDKYGEGTFTVNNKGGGASHNHGKTGSALSNTTNNNMPAYFTVYCWYRTA